MRGELLLHAPAIDISNRIPPPCVFATQDSTMKDSTQTFNIKSHDDELAHIRAREVQTHIIMANANVNVANAAAPVASSNVANATQTVEQPAAQPATIVEGTVKKFSLKVMRVQLFEDADIVNVQLSFDKAIPGFVRDDNGDYVAADVDRISLSRSALTRALCEHDEMIATVRDGQSTPLTRAQISTILHGATVVLARTFHAAGYVEEGRDALTRDQWFTTIEGVTLSKFAQQLIQQLVMQRLMNE